MFKFINSFRGIVLFIAVEIILVCFWIGLEYILDGKIVSQHSDEVMCFILCMFITNKILEYMESEKNAK